MVSKRDEYLDRLNHLRRRDSYHENEEETSPLVNSEEDSTFREGRRLYREIGEKGTDATFGGNEIFYEFPEELFPAVSHKPGKPSRTRSPSQVVNLLAGPQGRDNKKVDEYVQSHNDELRAIAHHVLTHPGFKEFDDGFNAALLYERMGKGKNAVPKLLKFIEKIIEYGGGEPDKRFYERVDEFIDRNTSDSVSQGGLEGKTMGFGFLTLAGIALGVGALRMTGNVIGSAANSSLGLSAIVVFVIGLVGMVLSFRENR